MKGGPKTNWRREDAVEVVVNNNNPSEAVTNNNNPNQPLIHSNGKYAFHNASVQYNLRWEFIKENKKTRFRPRKVSRKKEVKENTLSTKKATKKRRKNFLVESVFSYFFFLLSRFLL